MASTSFRRRRPLLYLLLAGFVVGVVWLTRAAWRPGRNRGVESAPPPQPAAVARPAPERVDATPASAAGQVATEHSPTEHSPTAQAMPAPAPEPLVAALGPQTPASAGPVDHRADDLTRIEGIGPKIAAALSAEGISTYQALAAATVERLRAGLANHGLRFAPSLATWPQQARLLSTGDQAGFDALTDQLGRRDHD